MNARIHSYRLCFHLCLLLVSLWPAWGWADSLTAEVDRTELSINETLTLTLTWTGQTMDSPDFSPLEADFEILSRQRRAQLAFGFGQDESSTQWMLTLAPKSTGEITIPALRLRGESSKPIALSVQAQDREPAGNRDIFVETELMPESVFVQGEALLTVRLYTAVNLGGVDFPQLEIDAARTIKVHDSQYRKTVNGRDYIVAELKYALFPENAGTLTIPALAITALVSPDSDPFGGSVFRSRGKPVRLRSEEKQLEVLPVPEAARSGPWLPAGELRINQRWSRPPEDLRVGEPITREITVTAQGLTGAQIPPLEIQGGEHFRLYPDQPEITENLSETGVEGIRRESVALVPKAPGTLTLPPVTVSWWDVDERRLRRARLPAQTLEIQPASQGDPARPAAEPGTESPPDSEGEAIRGSIPALPWFYLSLATNAVLILLLGLLFLRRRRGTDRVAGPGQEDERTDHEGDAFARLMDTPEDQHRRFRERIVHWGRWFWPESRISTLADVTRHCGDEDLARRFTELDRNLYGNVTGADVDVAAIKRAIKRIRRQWRSAGVKPAALKPLYPTT